MKGTEQESNLTFKLIGDRGVLVELGSDINPEINRDVRNLWVALEKEDIEGTQDIIPGYCSLLVYYDFSDINSEELIERIRETVSKLSEIELPPPKVYNLPVLYGGEAGPDLDFVAEKNELSAQEVIDVHTSRKYLIYMIGFAPGFPYLGGMSEEIATPRLQEPRTKTPARSVGIAETQTGVYPLESPGGWRLIGRTPVELFTPEVDPPVLLEMGDYVKFFQVSKERYQNIREEEKDGIYEVEVRELEGEEDVN